MILMIKTFYVVCVIYLKMKNVLYECNMHANIRSVYLPVKPGGQHYSVTYLLYTTNPDIMSQFPYIYTTCLKCANNYNEMYIL